MNLTDRFWNLLVDKIVVRMHLEPEKDNAFDLGRAAYRWRRLYAAQLPDHDHTGDAGDGAKHDILTAHAYTGGAALDVFGLSAANTLAKLTPSSNPGAAAAILKTDASGNVQVVTLSASRVIVAGDLGGVADVVALTSVTAGVSTGTGTVKMIGAGNYNNTGWLKIYVGTSAYYIPYW